STILLVAFYLLTPLLILYSCKKLSILRRIGAIIIAYGVGIVAGVSGLLPENSAEIQDIIATISIPLAIPLMLFSSNMKSWSRLAGNTVISMIIALFAVVTAVVVGYLIFLTDDIPELWKVGGLLIGVYTGGTPNLAALKFMLDVNNDTYLITHAYDMIIGAGYFFFLLTIGQKVFSYVLPKFKPGLGSNDQNVLSDMSENPMWGLFKRSNHIPMLVALGISIAIFAVAGATTLFTPANSQMIVVILLITTLGILLSLIPSVNKLNNTFELGMYFILIFSIDVASMVDISSMVNASPTIFYYVFLVVFGSLFLQVVVSAIFKIDTDTVIITSTALICSPPFVPAVAGAIKNKEIIVPGLTVGIIGYAIGNYLGVLIAEFLHSF
ncbi:MAG: DUF819 family protein, partial [Bacteroidales bacterium]|nr:DUF819 family protein [Bacteroidales bacterium]